MPFTSTANKYVDAIHHFSKVCWAVHRNKQKKREVLAACSCAQRHEEQNEITGSCYQILQNPERQVSMTTSYCVFRFSSLVTSFQHAEAKQFYFESLVIDLAAFFIFRKRKYALLHVNPSCHQELSYQFYKLGYRVHAGTSRLLVPSPKLINFPKLQTA